MIFVTKNPVAIASAVGQIYYNLLSPLTILESTGVVFPESNCMTKHVNWF